MDRVTADQAIDLLAASGIPVEVRASSGVDLLIDGRVAVQLKVMQTPATPSQVDRDMRAADQLLLYVVPRMTTSLRAAAMGRGVAVAALEDRLVVINGEEFSPVSVRTRTPTLSKSSRRTPWGRFALMRALCRTAEPRTQYQLAEEIGVSQAAVSQALAKLAGHAVKLPEGWRIRDVRSMATQFLAEYPGAGGIGVNWFSLEPVIIQAQKALDVGMDNAAIVSGDAGADRIAPWRKPRTAIVYATGGIELAKAGFAQTTADKATLEVRVPEDPTIWFTADAFTAGRRAWTTDPLIVSHDIGRTGGADAEEAIEHMLNEVTRQWKAS
jgi:hypothetical protein